MSGGWELVGGEWGYEIDTPEGIIGLSANAEQAKLIAAAPELVEALESARPYVVLVARQEERIQMQHGGSPNNSPTELLEAIDAVLAKVKGGE